MKEKSLLSCPVQDLSTHLCQVFHHLCIKELNSRTLDWQTDTSVWYVLIVLCLILIDSLEETNTVDIQSYLRLLASLSVSAALPLFPLLSVVLCEYRMCCSSVEVSASLPSFLSPPSSLARFSSLLPPPRLSRHLASHLLPPECERLARETHISKYEHACARSRSHNCSPRVHKTHGEAQSAD